MRYVMQRSPWLDTKAIISQASTPLMVCLILTVPAALILGVAVGILEPIYDLTIAGTLIIMIILFLRWDEVAVALVIAVHLWIDWYLDLHLVGILMMVMLLFVYYFGRSTQHPWVWPRLLWLWIPFLLLNIYPAINGGQFLLWDAATYYPSIVLGAFVMFWLGNIVAKDIHALRHIFQLLSFIATLIAIHSLIEVTTGIFLLATPSENIHLLTTSNLDISGTSASRATSFFIDPDWNGCFLATMAFLPLGLFIESKSLLSKLMFFAETVVILLALLFTYSNGSLIALACGSVVFVFWVGSQRARLWWVIIIVFIAIFIPVVLSEQLAVELQHASVPFEFSLREGAWETGIRVIEAYPFFGVGLGIIAYINRSEPYRVPAQFQPLAQPHDAYLQWGAMSGLPVMIIFFLLLGYSFLRSWRAWKYIDIQYRPLLGVGITSLIVLSINSVSIDGWTNAVIATIGWLIFGALTSPLLLDRNCNRVSHIIS